MISVSVLEIEMISTYIPQTVIFTFFYVWGNPEPRILINWPPFVYPELGFKLDRFNAMTKGDKFEEGKALPKP